MTIVCAYADADWGSDKMDRKSVSGLAFYHYGNLVSWGSKKQQVVALSTAEAEYMAAALCATEVIYPKELASDFNSSEVQATLSVDNMSAIPVSYTHLDVYKRQHDTRFP